jgi:hypothetical protein
VPQPHFARLNGQFKKVAAEAAQDLVPFVGRRPWAAVCVVVIAGTQDSVFVMNHVFSGNAPQNIGTVHGLVAREITINETDGCRRRQCAKNKRGIGQNY